MSNELNSLGSSNNSPGRQTPCKKEIFATHDRFITVPGIPANAVAYEMTDPLTLASLDASTAYLHLFWGIVNGTMPNPPIGQTLSDYFATPQTGVLFTDTTTIQSIIDVVVVQMGLSVGDVTYAVNTDNQPIWFLTPAAVAELSNNTYLHLYWDASDVWNNYDHKADITVIASNPNVLLGNIGTECVAIQEIKEVDTCTGEESYRFVIEDGNGILVPVIDIYPSFTEDDVLVKCPEFIYETKEICAKIDNSTDCYEIFVINKRNKDTWAISSSIYEDKDGNVITGTVQRVPCTCDCISEITTVANRVCFGYATSFNGRDVLGDKITQGVNLSISYLNVDGVDIITTDTLLGTTTGGFTSVDVGYGLAFNKMVDLLNTSTDLQNAGIKFVPAASPNTPTASYDPMGYGVEYDDTKEVRLVIYQTTVGQPGIPFYYSYRFSPIAGQTFDVLGDARGGTSWDLVDVENNTGPVVEFQNCQAL